MMTKLKQERCPLAVRRAGALGCLKQEERGDKFAFCAHQAFCHLRGRYELTDGADTCVLRNAEAEKPAEAEESAIEATEM